MYPPTTVSSTATPEVTNRDYVDVVMVANLQTYMSKPDHPYITKLNWHDVTAFNRVGLDPNIGDNEDEDLNAEMEAAMAMLQAN